MTIEAQVANLTVAVNAQTAAVVANQLITTTAQAAALATKNRVDALNLVDNTSDNAKPISTAAALALAGKQSALVSGVSLKSINSISLLGSGDLVVLSAPTSLRYLSYDNRASLRVVGVPAPQADDSTIVEGLGLFQFIESTEEPDDDETCFTASNLSGQWLLAVPALDLLEAYALIEDSIRDESEEDEVARLSAYFVTK
jgi:hypothetical protein